jgi:hypothetical protein
MLAAIDFFSAVSSCFSEFLAIFHAHRCPALLGIQDALGALPPGSGVADGLLCLALDKRTFVIARESSTLQNRAALRMLRAIRDSDDEARILHLLCNLCEFSVLNAFECFSCDIVGYLMDWIAHDRHIYICVAFFDGIGSMFFSPLVVRQLIHALRLDEKGIRILLNSFQVLLLADAMIPVLSFFHFAGEGHGIVGQAVDAAAFLGRFALATAFKQEERSLR